jgi:glycosyltransferase involved in cell wall biosynthesis
MDIGVMPLDDGPWEQGKCGYKIVQYMAAGLPVVASPVGSNRTIVTDGLTGLFASSPGEWAHAIERLAREPDTRVSMGAAGRARCELLYTVEAQTPVIAGVLAGTAGATRA